MAYMCLCICGCLYVEGSGTEQNHFKILRDFERIEVLGFSLPVMLLLCKISLISMLHSVFE